MFMKFILCPCSKFFPTRDTCDKISSISTTTSSNLREEYAKAFRTESYLDFWSRVLNISSSSSAARLPSYRLFVDTLLDPDQSTATLIISHAHKLHHHDHHHLLLSDFFSETSNASILCSLLLKDIESIRIKYNYLKTTINTSTPTVDNSHFFEFSKTLSPRPHFISVQEAVSNLLNKLEKSRKKAATKLKLISRIKRALGLIFIAVMASASVIGVFIALHALLALIALPSFSPASSRWLRRALAQLDAATKGAYILNRDLDTVSRLVDRVQDEVENVLALLRLCLEMAGDRRRRVTAEVVRQLKKSDVSFKQKLDELEEHLYLCFMTINKARNLVIKEVVGTSNGREKGKG
ncbi:hypothetical protein DsansV1_C22g0173021 [Dioscorea sansibarensis]